MSGFGEANSAVRIALAKRILERLEWSPDKKTLRPRKRHRGRPPNPVEAYWFFAGALSAAQGIRLDMRGRRPRGSSEPLDFSHIVERYVAEHFGKLERKQRRALERLFRRSPKKLALEALLQYYRSDCPSERSIESWMAANRKEVDEAVAKAAPDDLIFAVFQAGADYLMDYAVEQLISRPG